MTEGYLRCREFDRPRESGIPTFGHPIDKNHGWVECKSKSFPGKKYYFNVESRCRTWGRPVSISVPTPVVEPVTLPSDGDVWDDASIDVSDFEDDEEEGGIDMEIKSENVDEKSSFISSKEAKRRKIFAEVLFKLYHCYGEDCNGNEIEDVTLAKDEAPLICKSETTEDDDANVDVPSILPEICYSSSSDGERYDEDCARNRRRLNPFRSKNTTNYRSNCQIMKNYQESSEDLKNWLKMSQMNCIRLGNLDLEERSDAIDSPIFEFRSNISSPCYEDGDRTRRDSGLYSEDEEEAESEGKDTDDNNEGKEEIMKIKKAEIDYWNDEKNFPPRLKPIEFTDLIARKKEVKPVKKKPPPNRKALKRANIDDKTEKPPPKKITKIIYEINGVRTINYDFPPPELPPGVVASNLSDSESSSIEMAYSLWDRGRVTKRDNDVNGQDTKDFILKQELIDVKEPCLSESSTSGSSSSSSDDEITSDSNSSDRSSDSSESSSSTGSSSLSESSVNSTLYKAVQTGSPGNIDDELRVENTREIFQKSKEFWKKSKSCQSSSDDNRSWRLSCSQTETDD